VRENLKVVRGDLDDAQIRTALTAVGLSDWVDELPHGLDTMLGPDGTTVSGGERRRLLLARAVVRGGPVLLLDEPTEHLDTARGDALLGALLDPQDTSLVPASSTVVGVTHRIEAIPTGTSILRLEDHRCPPPTRRTPHPPAATAPGSRISPVPSSPAGRPRTCWTCCSARRGRTSRPAPRCWRCR